MSFPSERIIRKSRSENEYAVRKTRSEMPYGEGRELHAVHERLVRKTKSSSALFIRELTRPEGMRPIPEVGDAGP